ncbi:MAG: DinB family protein [Anaerolineae bacterium]
MKPFFSGYLDVMTHSHAEFKKTFADLPQEALDWVPGTEMNSFCVLVVHTAGATRYWVGDVAMGELSGRDRAAEFLAHGLDGDTLRQRLDNVLTYTQGVLERLTLDDLERVCIVPRDGRQTTAGWALLHALEHISLHLGHAQITRQLWDQRRDS